jgi:hypothetical protein
MSYSFDYAFAPVSDLHAVTAENEKTGKSEVTGIAIGDDVYQPSQRFWTSLFARFGFNKSFFKYFDHSEVFERIAERESADRMRVCIEKSEKGNRLLSVSNPTKPVVTYDELMGMLESYGGDGISYNDGVIESTHAPRSGGGSFDVAGDLFNNRFVLSSPIDGYGLPNVYLSLLRQVCANGMIAMSKAFRSSVALGKGDDNVQFALTRVLDQFGNDEGYAALRSRMESATNSWASVNEAQKLYKLLVGLHHDGAVGTDGAALEASPNVRQALANGSSRPMGEDDEISASPLLTAFHGMTGDTSKLYGLANLDALSSKRQQTLPVKCTVYDLINFATEVSTHHASTGGARRLNGMVGTLITEEYDMEGTKDRYGDFADFHINSKMSQGLTGSEHSSN